MRISLVVLFFLGIFSCSPCGDEKGARFGIKALQLTAVRLLADSGQDNRMPVFRALTDGESIRYDSLLLLATVDLQMVEKTHEGTLFGNAAYACDPAIDYDRVNKISILTDAAYGNQFDNELFEVGGGLIRPEFPVWYFEGKQVYEQYLIGLRKGPLAEGSYSFSVEITGDDNRMAAGRIEDILIKP